jgi:serine/threonine protein phosphatase PrpC
MPYEAMSSLAEPQATIVTAVVRGSKAWISWVGDSRAYELGPCNRQLTVDDSWYEMAVAQGMSKEVAQADRRAHAITQCLGMRDEMPEVHIKEVTLEPGSAFLLCTDGLWNYYEEASVLAGLMTSGNPDDSAMTISRRFIDKANEAGGRDNISVAFLKPAA